MNGDTRSESVSEELQSHQSSLTCSRWDAFAHCSDASLCRKVSGRIPTLHFIFVLVIVAAPTCINRAEFLNLWWSRSVLSLFFCLESHVSALGKEGEPLLWGRQSALNTFWFNYILLEESPHGAEVFCGNRPRPWKLTCHKETECALSENMRSSEKK